MAIKFRVVTLWYNYRYEVTTVQTHDKNSIPIEFDSLDGALKWIDEKGEKTSVYQIHEVYEK